MRSLSYQDDDTPDIDNKFEYNEATSSATIPKQDNPTGSLMLILLTELTQTLQQESLNMCVKAVSLNYKIRLQSLTAHT